MAVITWPDVEAHASALGDVPVAAQTDILAHVNTTLCVTEFDGEDGPKTRLARIYLAAHFGSFAVPGDGGAGGVSGPVKKDKVGEIEVDYADAFAGTGSGDSSMYRSTSYGRSYLAIVRNSLARAWRVL